jgi:hypothetical protein
MLSMFLEMFGGMVGRNKDREREGKRWFDKSRWRGIGECVYNLFGLYLVIVMM